MGAPDPEDYTPPPPIERRSSWLEPRVVLWALVFVGAVLALTALGLFAATLVLSIGGTGVPDPTMALDSRTQFAITVHVDDVVGEPALADLVIRWEVPAGSSFDLAWDGAEFRNSSTALRAEVTDSAPTGILDDGDTFSLHRNPIRLARGTHLLRFIEVVDGQQTLIASLTVE